MNQSKLRNLITNAHSGPTLCNCRSCDKELSLTSERCIHCGDVDPFYFSEILAIFNQKMRNWNIASVIGFLVGLPAYVIGGFILLGIIYWLRKIFLMNGFYHETEKLENKQKGRLSEAQYTNWWYVKNSISVGFSKSLD